MTYLLSQKANSGFTLLEIMIAMVIISVGVLGLAGLQGASIKSSNTAFMRTVATNQIYDLAERIRSNTDGHMAGDYNFLSGLPSHASCDTVSYLPSDGCTTSDLARRDVEMWNTENARVLPNGQGSVDFDVDSYIIIIYWDENNIGGTPICDPLNVNTWQCVKYKLQP